MKMSQTLLEKKRGEFIAGIPEKFDDNRD